MPRSSILVVGAGMGGLACAIELASQGLPVCLLERNASAGGKMRESVIGGRRIDSGPTVMTMRWVFDDLFQAAEAEFDRHVILRPLDVLARHAWSGGDRLDLFADLGRATEAIGTFAGAPEAARFISFCIQSRAIYQTLKRPFLTSSRPAPATLVRRIGVTRMTRLVGLRPCETLWQALSKQFHDPRLRQLFGRYATYSGSSPFAAPATLMLIAHVEREGVWTVEGGMQRLAEALERLATSLGVVVRFGAEVRDVVIENGRAVGVTLADGERIEARSVVVNGDVQALAGGCFGEPAKAAVSPQAPRDRSLSAITWAMTARTGGFPLSRHNVFFSDDYAAEFDDLFAHRRLPRAPTVYVCAQDRDGRDRDDRDRVGRDDGGPVDEDRLLMLVNAPATGDSGGFDAEEIERCEKRVLALLDRCGLSISRSREATSITTPREFHRLFPGTGGALYGRASHGWRASFQRPRAETPIPGLYLAGGSTHPGAGVPMAALSGRLAAWRLISDLVSTQRFHQVAITGGMSTA